MNNQPARLQQFAAAGRFGRWAPPLHSGEDPEALDTFIVRLAADGLWIHEALSSRPLPKSLRKKIARRLVAMAGGREAP